jgi:hypothetical protein
MARALLTEALLHPNYVKQFNIDAFASKTLVR